MIVPNDRAPPSPMKGQSPQQAIPQAYHHPEQHHPPAYYAGHQHIHSHPLPGPHESLILGGTRRQSPAARFCKALGMALLVWFLVTAFFQSITDWPSLRIFDRVGWPVPEDGDVVSCVGPGNGSALPSGIFGELPFTQHVHFKLPVASDTLFFLSRGSHSSGSVHIEKSSKESDVVEVDVDVSYRNTDALERANICLLKKPKQANGVGIFTPRTGWWRRDDQLRFRVTIRLPSSSDGKPLFINKFLTDYPNFSQDMVALDGLVDFGTLHLSSTNGVITAQSVHGEIASITSTNARISGSVRGDFVSVASTNGPISGSFSGSNVILKTSNARIDAKVELNYSSNSWLGHLEMKTTNGPIDSSVALKTDPLAQSPGIFVVQGTTSNSALKIGFVEQPVGSRLTVIARSSNSPATVELHPAFEGTFNLESSMLSPRLDQREVEDPKGEGRRRTVVIESRIKSNLLGSVWWGENRAEGSSVAVKTSNSAATLSL